MASEPNDSYLDSFVGDFYLLKKVSVFRIEDISQDEDDRLQRGVRQKIGRHHAAGDASLDAHNTRQGANPQCGYALDGTAYRQIRRAGALSTTGRPTPTSDVEPLIADATVDTTATDEQELPVPDRMIMVAELRAGAGIVLEVYADVGEGDGAVLCGSALAGHQHWADLAHHWGLDVTVTWRPEAHRARDEAWRDEAATGIEQALSDWNERNFTPVAPEAEELAEDRS